MRRIARTALCGFALSAALLPGVGPAFAGGCDAKALDVLKAASPDGHAIFRQVKDKAFFRTWLDCQDAQLGLPTAVHESVHVITGDDDAYPLIGGGAVKRPPEGGTPLAPARIARHFRPSLFVTTYLRPGGATSATEFRYLLDELNAYTHDLATAIALDDRRGPGAQTSHRDGLAALMSFVGLYVEAAGTDPATWTGLNRPETRNAVAALWDQAERTMLASCRIPDIGSEDRMFLGKLCAAGPQAALARLLGRAPVCPKACLAAGLTAAGP
ncbi:hypothetical protein [Methylobacterium nonmethylotrophicum]|uniref:Chitosanase n=1 Tax=Methylobacterium nonmethylotrophicum TaxID=1141884 RepID=A0A4Z0NI91_9HYPH|nr:hypothetical protein [Methylobacterium nonmethylotrophicum]TGD96046.1 hypothetical protein EU555_25120 [Methylobacterium nonmethylotrophicum]